jgi:ribosomal protein L11 methylase PrmA
VIRQGERLLRAVTPEAAPDVERLLRAPWFRARMDAGSLPVTRWTDAVPTDFAGAGAYRWLEHETLRFPCYPHEITAAQLHESACLTLSLALEALENGWILKDASAWNVLFDGGRPVFCDILSFESGPTPALWPAYAQFQRHFIIPLLLNKHLGIRPETVFLQHRDGVPPGEARRMLKGLKAWRQPSLEAVTLPALFTRQAVSDNRRGGSTSPRITRDPALGKHLLARTYRRLQRHLDRLAATGSGKASTWVNYERERDHYSAADLEAKRAFIKESLADPGVRTVLDLGCNTGEFSFLAATLGKEVVAADFDGQCLERLYARAREQHSPIQPLVLNIGRPTPAVGWMNREVPSVLERAQGRFDCVMMLGLVHHLLVTERATLEMIFELVRALQAARLIIEWVEPGDRRFREISAINAGLYAHLSRETFEAELTGSFVIDANQPLPGGTRVLYACTRR